MSKLVYTALSKHSFYANMHICAFVFKTGNTPINPFNLFGYFLYDLVDRDIVRSANSLVIERVDEVWTFGPIADGVAFEVQLAKRLNKTVRFFTVGSKISDIIKINPNQLVFEQNISQETIEKLTIATID